MRVLTLAISTLYSFLTAFFSQSGLMRVLTLAISTLYSFLTAFLIIGLFALLSTMNTRVLKSSIFFMADSVVRGYLIKRYWSSLLVLFTLLRGYFGFLLSLSVLGRLKWTDVLIFRLFLSCFPRTTVFFALKALAFTTPESAFTGTGAFFSSFAGTALAAGFLAFGLCLWLLQHLNLLSLVQVLSSLPLQEQL